MEACCTAAPTAASLGMVFVGGLVSSAHCLGMCGPLVALAEGMRPAPAMPWAQLPLHAGRILTYSAMGAIFGLVGAALEHSAVAVGLRGAASLLGGLAMVLLALVLLDWLPWRGVLTVSQSHVTRFVRGLTSRRPLGGLLLGVYWGFLPCGLVWAMLAAAAATGSVTGGALVMAAFGAGTVPALLLAGGLAALMGPRLRAHLPQIAAASVMLIGVLMLLRGAAGAGWIPHLHLASNVPLY